MFDVGFTEMLLIGVVALVVIGPERLPDVARTVGSYVGKLQRFVTGVKRDFKKELEAGELKKLIGDQKEQIDELRKMVDTTRKDFEKSATEVTGDAKKRFAEIQEAAGHGITKDDAPKLAGSEAVQETPVDLDAPSPVDDVSVEASADAEVDVGEVPADKRRAAGADEG